MSLARAFQRRIDRKNGDTRDPAPMYRVEADGGYSVLHPTRGWRKFSPKRALLLR